VPGVFLLVTGASGAGKSTVRALIAPQLSPMVECVELGQIVDVPAMPTKAWRQSATEAVVRSALELQQDGRHLLLSGDPVAAGEVAAAPSAVALDGLAICLLDLSPEAQAARLAVRGDDLALLPRHQAFAEWMRRHAEDPLHMLHVLSTDGWHEMRWDRLAGLAPGWRIVRVDTTAVTREGVATAVLEWCHRALGGEAPIIRLV
jgi:energy-coupling factor transporter ATP-binding protein EcfA2